jgi:hypothetical protein
MSGHHAIMTEHNEERWRTIRKGIAPAYSMVAIRCVCVWGGGGRQGGGFCGGGRASPGGGGSKGGGQVGKFKKQQKANLCRSTSPALVGCLQRQFVRVHQAGQPVSRVSSSRISCSAHRWMVSHCSSSSSSSSST